MAFQSRTSPRHGQANEDPNTQVMFQAILSMLEKSVGLCFLRSQPTDTVQQTDIADLRNECAELRISNSNLERHIRDSLYSSVSLSSDFQLAIHS